MASHLSIDHIAAEKKASAYILLVPPNRRNIILSAADHMSFYREPLAAEPVRRFDHSRNVPLVVLASFEDGAITSIPVRQIIISVFPLCGSP